MHFPHDLFFFPDSGLAEVVALLQIQPELRASPEIMSQTQSGFWSNGAPAVHYLTDAGCRDMNIHRELVLADLQGLEKLFKQHDAGMGGYGAELPAGCRLPEWGSRRAGLVRIVRLVRMNLQPAIPDPGPERQPTQAFQASSTAFPRPPRRRGVPFSAFGALFLAFAVSALFSDRLTESEL